MAQLDSDIPREVRIIEDYYGDNFGIGNTIIASDVEISSTPSNQSSTIQGYINFIRDTGGVGKIVLPPSSSSEPIWIGTTLDLDDLLYLEICGQGDPGLSGGYGTVLRQIAASENAEVRIFVASDSSGNGVYYFHDFAMWGAHAEFPTLGGDSNRHVFLLGAEKITFERVGSYYSRQMGITAAYCDEVRIIDCRLERVGRDAINITECNNRVITGNRIKNCSDDAIAVHTNFAGGNPRVQPAIIADNIIEDAYGIKVMGMVRGIIKGNNIERPKGYGITVQSGGLGASEGEGDTTDLLITNNIITNVIQSSLFAGAGSSISAIKIVNDTGNFSAPVVGGTIPFINYPELVSPVSNLEDSTNAGAHRIVIKDNIIAQTLPQVDNYSDWGFGTPYYYTGFADISNFRTAFHLKMIGVQLSTATVDVTVKDNIFEGVSWALFASVDFTYIGYAGFIGNKVRRTSEGVAWINHTSAVKHGKLDIRDNEIDCDPFFESTNRDYVNAANSTVTISNASPAVIGWTAHGLSANTPVRFTTTGALPTGLTVGTSYYVLSSNLNTDDFTVSATVGGAAINTTDAGSGTHTCFSYSAVVAISNDDPAVISWTDHGLSENTAVRFTTTGALPAGLTASSTEGARSYYVRGGATLLDDSFTIASYPNGPAKATTDAGSGAHTVFCSIPDGTWTAGDSTPYLVEAQDWETFNFTGNRVQNFNRAFVSDADTKFGRISDNILYFEPDDTATLASAVVNANRGVRDPGTLPRGGNTWIHTDCDPTSSTYGQTLTQRNRSGHETSIPTAGFYLAGEIVWNNAATEDTLAVGANTLGTGVIGWRRLTTGSNHELDTDWREILALTGGVT